MCRQWNKVKIPPLANLKDKAQNETLQKKVAKQREEKCKSSHQVIYIFSLKVKLRTPTNRSPKEATSQSLSLGKIMGALSLRSGRRLEQAWHVLGVFWQN